MDIGLLILGFFFVALSASGGILGIFEYRNGRRSSHWPWVAGEIEESSIQYDDDSPFPSIRYKYNVGSVRFNCDRILYEARRCDHKTATAFIEKYPVGRQVRVYFDPAEPGVAVLEPGVSIATGIVAMLVLIAFQAAGWSMLYFAIAS